MNLPSYSVRYLIKILSYAKGGMEITKEEASKGLGFLSPRKATTKAKTFKRARSARKAAKYEKHRLSTKEIRAAVFQRAHEICEAPGCTRCPTVMDHWLGGSGQRRPKQAVATCWALCPIHNYRRTHNIPDAAFWNAAFAQHCSNHGYAFKGHVEHAKVPAPQTPKPDPGQTHYQGDGCPGGHLVEVDPSAPQAPESLPERIAK